MTGTLRQLRAVGLLCWRSVTRGDRRGGPPKTNPRHVFANLVFRVLLLGLISALQFQHATPVARLVRGRQGATTLVLVDLTLLALGTAGLLRWNPRRAGLPILTDEVAVIGMLPLRLSAQLLLALFRAGLAIVFIASTLLGLAPERLGHEWPTLFLISVTYAIVTLLVGTLACTLVLSYPTHRRGLWGLRALTWLGFGGFFLCYSAPTIGDFRGLRIPPLDPLSIFLTTGAAGSFWEAFRNLAVAGLLALVSISSLERRGFDRVAVTPTGGASLAAP